jgi:glutamine amidotransferase-like uncharacterized protein
VDLRVFRPRDVTARKLADVDVIVFTGGSGARQGESLGEDGRAAVKSFVESGGGYVGICAGAYLAMQGEPEFFKLGILAGKNLSGDFWKRGVAAVDVRAGDDAFSMHYANGPIFAPEVVDGLAPYTGLALFESDMYATRHGTMAGEMPGTPAIVAARYGRGKMVLFSPNPVLGAPGVGHPEMFVDALEWTSGDARGAIRFGEVFDGVWQRHPGVVWRFEDPAGRGD